jgi:hypothetical protein
MVPSNICLFAQLLEQTDFLFKQHTKRKCRIGLKVLRHVGL